MALPGTHPIVQCQMKQRQYCLVDLVGIKVHDEFPSRSDRSSVSATNTVKHGDRLTLTSIRRRPRDEFQAATAVIVRIHPGSGALPTRAGL
jgi:hypothetical protein